MKRALALLVLAGCNQLLGVDDFHTSDGGGGPDADPNSVTGTSMISYVVFDGTIETGPEDLSAYTIKAYVPDGSGHFDVIDGTGRADGTFEIPGVPAASTYYLYLLYPQIPNHATPVPRFFVTDRRTVDLGYHVMGRRDAVEATQASSVVLDLTNMVAWGPADLLLVDSYNNGSEFSDMGLVTNVPSPNDTSVSGFSFDWRDGYTYHPIGSLPRLIDAAQGDDFYVTHLHNENVYTGTWHYSVARQLGVYQRDDLVQADGTPLNVSGAFTPIPLSQTEHVTIDVAALRDQMMVNGGHGFYEYYSVNRLDNAGTQYQERIGSGPWGVGIGSPYLGFEPLAAVPDVVDLPNVSYGEATAFPSSWGQVVISTYGVRRRVAAPGAVNTTGLVNFHDVYEPVGAAYEFGPGLRPIATLTIGGVPALGNGGVVPFDGTTGVTVTWDVVPQADRYQVDLVHVYEDAGNTLREPVAAWNTTDPSIVIPADLLVVGDRYAVGVMTVTGVDAIGLRRIESPGATTRQYSNLFVFSGMCGDGVTQAAMGEECDDGGESAGCDADCSLPFCHDGYVNVTAGETCDHGGASFGCDGDCTAVMCADGNWNPMVEQCDDGNLAPGDGCSPTCTREGTCGDGVLNPVFETCDPPGGSCGPDCNPP